MSLLIVTDRKPISEKWYCKNKISTEELYEIYCDS